ncbi:jg27036, partial [Pararge aegeria aegeria]
DFVQWSQILERIDEKATLKVWSTIKKTCERKHMPPYYCPKDLEGIFDVQCNWSEPKNRDSFDENLKGFTPLS